MGNSIGWGPHEAKVTSSNPPSRFCGHVKKKKKKKRFVENIKGD
jgi:hypothetical protein